MKELPIRKFTTVVEFLTEPTTITNNGAAIGQFLPKVWLDKVPTIPVRDRAVGEGGVNVDDVKKAIEPDKVKIQERPGKPPELSKGLGDIPGMTRSDPTFGQSRPAPKPGKTK